jgi:hypothetical protein
MFNGFSNSLGKSQNTCILRYRVDGRSRVGQNPYARTDHSGLDVLLRWPHPIADRGKDARNTAVRFTQDRGCAAENRQRHRPQSLPISNGRPQSSQHIPIVLSFAIAANVSPPPANPQYWFEKSKALIRRVEGGQKRAELFGWYFERVDQLLAGNNLKTAERIAYDELCIILFGTKQ